MRRFCFAVIVVLLVVGACSNAATEDATGPSSSEVRPSVTSAPSSRASGTTTAPSSAALPRGDWYLVWVTGWLPEGFAEGLREVSGVDVVSVVWVGNAHVVETMTEDGTVVDRAPEGFVIPVELQGIDPVSHAEFVPPQVAALLAGLADDEVALGRSSARLRRLGLGATLTLEDGTSVTVAAVIDDEWIGAAELVTTRSDPVPLGADRARYAILRYEGSRRDLESALAVLTEQPVRVWAEGEIPILRHADPVRSQIAIKERFGEFAYRPGDDQRFGIDPDWVSANIVTVELPLLGNVTCHRDFADLLRQVMERLDAAGLDGVIDPSAFKGCWNPRFIRGRRDLSRHAWGVAADINFGNPLEGPGSPIAPVLLETMEAMGITSGHDWINPDPGHFEWYGLGA
ncbi:MAG: M15 family metallopeptidase [Acidimicrobiia bacterium]